MQLPKLFNKIPPAFTILNTKGGVGKSSCATSVAMLLSDSLSVGFIDCDMCSSNTQQILNLKHKKAERVLMKTGYEIVPREIRPNLKYMGINLVQDRACSGTQLKGTSQSSMFGMMVKEVIWGKIDCFILDMPAGTDDIFLSIPDTFGDSFKGLFIVTQPKTIIDCKKVIELCGVQGFKILGLIENMVGSLCSCHGVPAECPVCSKKFSPFGQPRNDALGSMADKYHIEICGQIPLTDGSISVAALPTLERVCKIIKKELKA